MTDQRDRPAPSGWRCTSCKEPVSLATAREHYDVCAGGDRDDEHRCCPVCEAPTDDDELCPACSEIAP